MNGCSEYELRGCEGAFNSTTRRYFRGLSDVIVHMTIEVFYHAVIALHCTALR